MHKPLVITGATLEGWLAAALLTMRLKPLGVKVVVVPTTEDIAPPPALATAPGLGQLHRELKLDERDIARFCGGTFRLGTQIKRAGRDSAGFLIGFAGAGEPRQGAAFHHYWRRAKGWDGARAFSAYNLAAAAAAKGKFAPPLLDAKDIRGRFEFGLHLSGPHYQDYLEKCALHYGAARTPARLAEVKWSADSRVDAITLDNGEEIPCSFVIDAAGPAGAIIGKGSIEKAATGPGTLIWRTRMTEANPGLTLIEMTDDGYDLHIPLYDRVVTGQYRKETDKASVTGSWRPHPWKDNVLALGRTAADLEPIHFPLTILAATAINMFTELLPFGNESPYASKEYNRRMGEVFARMADFQHLHHILHDGQAEDARLPEPLKRKLTQFRARGRVVTYDHESFDEDTHLALYLGAGLIPERYDALAGIGTDDQVQEILSTTLKSVRAARDEMPNQREWLEKTGIARKLQEPAR